MRQCATLSHVSTQARVHRSFRLRPDVSERLERRAAETGASYTSLAERFIDEGLRRERFPQVGFVDGPAGRRARLIGTRLDIWMLVEIIRASGSVEAAAAHLEQPLANLQVAAAYYIEYPGEIDAAIELNRAVTQREEALSFKARQPLA